MAKMTSPQKPQEEEQSVNEVEEVKNIDYDSMTITELKAVLDEKDIKYTSKMTKAELIELLNE